MLLPLFHSNNTQTDFLLGVIIFGALYNQNIRNFNSNKQVLNLFYTYKLKFNKIIKNLEEFKSSEQYALVFSQK